MNNATTYIIKSGITVVRPDQLQATFVVRVKFYHSERA